MPPHRISLFHSPGQAEQFAGLQHACRTRGLEVERVTGDLPRGSSLLVVSDCVGVPARRALREAREAGVPSILLMDGILDYRNTFENPRVGPRFLRPAPVDLVACIGNADRVRLEMLGNRAVATGLPRLGIPRWSPPTAGGPVLVATARTPVFSPGERPVIVEALRGLRTRLEMMGIEARWRLTAGLESEVGVLLDQSPLDEAIAECAAVITTPSTLLIEAMLAGRPVALLHCFPSPCWSRAAWNIGARPSPNELSSLLSAEPARMQLQARLLADQCQIATAPAEALADVCARAITLPVRTDIPPDSVARVPRVPAPRTDRPRVVSLVACLDSPVGGVTTWSQRLARAMPEHGYDMRTLLVVRDPDGWSIGDHRGWIDERTDVCVLDPLDSPPAQLRTIRRAVDALGPAIVLPNYFDACYAVATQAQALGARAIAIAHTDSGYYRELIETYDSFDGAVAVSGQISEWLEPLAGDRPCPRLVYGIPVASEPRSVPSGGPLRLAYIGRVTETQKRVSDLVPLIAALHERGLDFEFHVIGDGDAMGRLRAALDAIGPAAARVALHGAKDPDWVQAKLPSIDISVLVSEYEGTSITMLEAMGHGVVPAVTQIDSGVAEWVIDGDTGLTAPVGDTAAMADRIEWLAADRERLRRLGRCAWRRARSQSVESMAERYAALFDDVLARPPSRSGRDLGMRLIEPQWSEGRPTLTTADRSWARRLLREAGFSAIGEGAVSAQFDASILDHSSADELVADLRARGGGAVRLPYLLDALPSVRLERLLREAMADGCTGFGVYGAGRHTRRARALFETDLPIRCIIDDAAQPGQQMFGLPVVTLEEAAADNGIDAILLSSDAFEAQMAERCGPLEERGVRVIRLYTAPSRRRSA